MAYVVQQKTPKLRQQVVYTEKRAERLALEWARARPGHQADVFRGSTHISSIFIKPSHPNVTSIIKGVENAGV